MVKKMGYEWGLSGSRVLDMGEGNPEIWASKGLKPYRTSKFLDDIVLGSLDGEVICDNAVFVAQPCIGRSSGRIELLPLSAIWECAVPLMFAKAFKSNSRIYINLAEECLQYPNLENGLKDVARFIAEIVERIAEQGGISVDIIINDKPPRSHKIFPKEKLYGIFNPFDDSSTYPCGFPNEENVLKAFNWYCNRYIDMVEESEKIVITEGVHMAGIVRLSGRDVSKKYIATVPLPDPRGGKCLLQDVPEGQRTNVFDLEAIRKGWWPDDLLESSLQVRFSNIIMKWRKTNMGRV